jgi:hypothetical protein
VVEDVGCGSPDGYPATQCNAVNEQKRKDRLTLCPHLCGICSSTTP